MTEALAGRVVGVPRDGVVGGAGALVAGLRAGRAERRGGTGAAVPRARVAGARGGVRRGAGTRVSCNTNR